MLLVKILYFIELEHRRLICHQWQARMHILIYLSFLFLKIQNDIRCIELWMFSHDGWRAVWYKNGRKMEIQTITHMPDATPNGCNLPRGNNFFLQPNRVDFVPQWLHIFSPRTMSNASCDIWFLTVTRNFLGHLDLFLLIQDRHSTSEQNQGRS